MKSLALQYARFSKIASHLQSPFLLAMRLYWGWQFAQTGWGKIHNMARIVDFFASLNIPFPSASAHFVAGLEFFGAPAAVDLQRIVGIFAKADASPDGRIRGRRTTMLSDADINYERHARAALGAVIASITNDPAIFVSGGTEHQCAPGAAPIAAIVRV